MGTYGGGILTNVALLIDVFKDWKIQKVQEVAVERKPSHIIMIQNEICAFTIII